MDEILSLVAGSEKLTRIYGDWPSFHDSEVVELHLWRGQIKPGDWDDSNVFPVLTVKIRILQDSPTTYDTLTTLRFADVNDYEMGGFNHQNEIFDLTIAVPDPDKCPSILVEFQEAFGMHASCSTRSPTRCGH